MTEELEKFASMAGTLAATDPDHLAGGESQVVLNSVFSQLEAVACRAAASFEASGAYVADEARSASAWLSHSCHLPEARARRQLRLGRAMRELPVAAAAFLAGEITSAHLSLLARLLKHRTAEALAAHEEMLVNQARELSFSDFERCVAYFDQLADEDGCEERDEQRRARRDVVLSSSISGMWLGHITLDPVSGEIVSDELRRIEAELYKADRAEAALRLGREPLGNDLRRTLSQRRADALVEMARRSAGAPGDGAGPVPLFSVLVDYQTLSGRICELASGQVVTPGSLLSHLDQALVERAVFGPAGRVEIGTRRRLFDGATRRAIELRDRRCCHPTCEVCARDCQVDHIVPFEDGGLTTQENGRLLCAWHNRLAWRQWRALDKSTRAELIARHHRQHAERQGSTTPHAGPLPDRGPPPAG